MRSGCREEDMKPGPRTSTPACCRGQTDHGSAKWPPKPLGTSKTVPRQKNQAGGVCWREISVAVLLGKDNMDLHSKSNHDG